MSYNKDFNTFPTYSSALYLSLFELISRQSAYTDSHRSVLSSPHSVVTRLGDSLDRSTASSTATFLTPHTDASREGWGAHLEPLSLIISGLWSPQEYHLHINNLEKLAVFLAASRFQHIFATPV
ncbi:hypothetical protein DPMN_164505 [Dreissena polymorpha]|uniref:Uncharacterized protein n=1 Tax=Dreissena polymorpha TaxID=45954 RepID=A0A9D4EV91_DREPO|nr:hypothetical protein DPMN_164505 [Dreissena polymorpha]